MRLENLKYQVRTSSTAWHEGYDLLISDLYVEWFPLLFGIFFFVSFLVDEARKRGHLKLGREPKTREIVGILVIFGFNLIVAAPILIVGLLIEYSVGAPPVMILLMSTVMALAELIPIFLSGISAFLLIKVLYQRWGVSVTVFFVTFIVAVLTILDSMGFLQPTMPIIIQGLTTLIFTEFEFLIMLVLLAVCLGRCTSGQHSKETKPQERKEVGSPSIESALRLIVGLGRRVVTDGDEEALEVLRTIYSTNQHSKRILEVAGREVNIDLEDILSRRDLSYSQQVLNFAIGRFGKLKKWIRNVILVFMFAAIASGLLVLFLVNIGFLPGLFLLEFTIMLPVLSGIGYQQTARYEAGRFSPPTVSQFNSYLLTRTEFKSRTIRERTLFAFSLILLGMIFGASLLGIFFTGLIWAAIAALVIMLAGVLSFRDRMLTSKRLEFSDVVERGLSFIGVKAGKDTDDESSTIEQPASTPEIIVSIPEVTGDWQQQLEMRGHTEFAKKVASRVREAYSEQMTTIVYLGGGGTMFFLGAGIFLMFSTLQFLVDFMIFPISLMVVGAPLLVFGVYKYRETINLTRFHGLARKNLTFLITHLDLKTQGIESFGSITDSQAPSEYLGFELVRALMQTFSRSAIIRLKDKIPWPREEIEDAWKTRSSYPKLEGMGFLLSFMFTIMLYLYFPTLHNDSFLYIMKMVLVGTVGIMMPVMLYAIVVYYREKHVLSEIVNSKEVDDKTTYSDTLNSFFDLLKSEFAMPLRVLLIGSYPQVAYTGLSYFTTQGFELREAVTIPQGAVIDAS